MAAYLTVRRPGRTGGRKKGGRSARKRGGRLGRFPAVLIGLGVVAAVAVYLHLDYKRFAAGSGSRVFAHVFRSEYFLRAQLMLNDELVRFLKEDAGVRESDVSERRVGMSDAHGRYEKVHWRIKWHGKLTLTQLSRGIEKLATEDNFKVKSRRVESREWGDYLYLELARDGRVSHSLLVALERRRLEPEEIIGTPATAGLVPPRAAIVIDDVGYDIELERRFIAIDAPLAFSVLPFLAESTASAQAAHSANREVLVHMPMEPRDYPLEDPGPGAILRSMDPEDVHAATLAALDAVPFAIGLNNHMGSRITTDPILIGMVLRTVKERNLFFIDSRTTASSVAYNMARRLGLRAANRKVFLDDVFDPYYIGKMLDELFVRARQDGEAIAIGHLNPMTLEALRANLWKARRYGVQLTPVSELVP